jgi:hypothetical protein
MLLELEGGSDGMRGTVVLGVLLVWALIGGLLAHAQSGTDICQGLPDPPQVLNGSNALAGTSFHLSVRAGVPAFRLTLRRRAPGNADHAVHVADIDVARCSEGRKVQTLPIVGYDQELTARSLHAQDINFDGFLDIGVLVEYGAKWGSESFWVFDPAAGKFIENDLTRQLRELKPNRYEFDAGKQEIRIPHLTEPWCRNTEHRYTVEDYDRLVLIHSEEARGIPGGGCEVVVSDRVGGKMQVTKVQRIAKPEP